MDSDSAQGAGESAADARPPPPPALTAGTVEAVEPVSVRSEGGPPLMCVAHRPDLLLPFASLTVAAPLRPDQRALLEAWLRESTSPWLSARQNAPCASSLLCGSPNAGQLKDLTAGALRPTQASFYQSRQLGLDRFLARLQRPGQRQLLLAELLSFGDAELPGDLEQLANRVSYVELSKAWSALREFSWWTFTAVSKAGAQTALTELSHPQAAPSGAGPHVAALPPQPTAAARPLRLGVDLDESITGAVVLWHWPAHGISPSQAAALPLPRRATSQLELVTSSEETFIGWRITSPSKVELVETVAELVAGSTAADPNATQREPEAGRSTTVHRLTHGTTLDPRCDVEARRAPQPQPQQSPLPPPGVVLTGFSSEDDRTLLERLGPRTSVRFFHGTEVLASPPPESVAAEDPDTDL